MNWDSSVGRVCLSSKCPGHDNQSSYHFFYISGLNFKIIIDDTLVQTTSTSYYYFYNLSFVFISKHIKFLSFMVIEIVVNC